MTLVGLVADDLTGAADSAVQFAEHGWEAVLVLRALDGAPAVEPTASRPRIVAVCTDSRAAGHAAAAAATAFAVRSLASAGADRLYVKVDSTVRGSVAGQVAGALTAWRERHPGAWALVCPAYPAMGRTVVGRTALAGGERLEDGPAGRDPVTPVATSDLSVLLPGSTHLNQTGDGSAGALADALSRAAAPGAVVTVDAADGADLDRLAAAVALLGPTAVPAGSAGLATALAGAWSGTADAAARPAPVPGGRGSGSVVVVVTSLHRVAREQEARLRASCGRRLVQLAPALDDLRDDEAAATWTAARTTPPDVDVVLITAPVERPGRPVPGTDVARRLAQIAGSVLEGRDARAVVAVGGDGARALVDHWGATGIAVLGAVAEGVPVGRLLDGEHPDLAFVTKAGGFGGPDALVDVLAHLDQDGRAGQRGARQPAADERTAT